MIPDINYLIPLAFIGLVGFGVGALVGFLLSDLRHASKSSQAKRNRNLNEIMTVYQDRMTGELAIEIKKRLYKRAGELKEKTLQALFILLDNLRSWIGEPKTDQVFSAVTLEQPSKVEEELDIVPPSETITPMNEGSTEIPGPAPATLTKEELILLQSITENEIVPEISPPSMNLTDVLSRAISPEIVKETPLESKSIALQVDEILQEKLTSSPFSEHTVRLLELPETGMVVIVDDALYEGVNDVPDPEIQQIIRNSVAEWERRISSS